ncbi:MAG: biotin/lipoyl-containing protein [Planctomycetaceae bacterium]
MSVNSSDAASVSVPDLGSDRVRVGQWLIEPGVKVASGDRLVELLAGSVLVHLTSAISGRLARIERPTGSTVFTNTVLAWIEPESP